MAQVNVDLSEYDMLRHSKEKAETEVEDLKEEVRKLKDNASNVVVRNRYYIPSIDYKEAARKMLLGMTQGGLHQLLLYADTLHHQVSYAPFNRVSIDEDVLKQLTILMERSLKDILDRKSAYIEDGTVTEIKGFDEISIKVWEELESQYKVVMEEKKAQLEREIESYNVKHLDVDKAVSEAENALTEKHKTEVDALEKELEDLKTTIKNLKEQLEEASKTSEEKLAEAMARLKAAQGEVAKYSRPKKWFNIFS